MAYSWQALVRMHITVRLEFHSNTFRDIMYELAEVGDLPLPQPSPQPSNKRDRNSEKTTSAQSGTESSPSPAIGSRSFAGTKRAGGARARQTHHDASSLSPTPSLSNQTLDTPSPPSTQSTMYTAPLPILRPVQASIHPATHTMPLAANDESRYTGSSRSTYTMGATYDGNPSTSQSSGGNVQPQAGQPLDMDPMFSMQSMMYDQVLSNLSASLTQPMTDTSSQSTGPQYVHPPDENLDEWLRMASLGAGAFLPDPSDNDASQSMWSAAPNGFE
jgi:hypothetical protein